MATSAGKAIDAAYLLKQLKAFEAQIIAVKYNIKFQFSTMPTPSATYLGQFAQYVGVTNSNYTEGYFYKCVLDGSDYKWTSVDQSSPEYTIKKDTTIKKYKDHYIIRYINVLGVTKDFVEESNLPTYESKKKSIKRKKK